MDSNLAPPKSPSKRKTISFTIFFKKTEKYEPLYINVDPDLKICKNFDLKKKKKIIKAEFKEKIIAMRQINRAASTTTLCTKDKKESYKDFENEVNSYKFLINPFTFTFRGFLQFLQIKRNFIS